jgi:indole-3-glycerol phosphate synthase
VTILEKILSDKRAEVAERSRSLPLEALRARSRQAPPPRSLFAALSAPGKTAFKVIAEVKKASPSKGVIRADFDPVAIARSYEKAGAAAISILTDEKHFQGRIEFLEAVRAEVDVPLLRKDFIIERYQVHESRAAGADAILLICAALPRDADLQALAGEAQALGMDVLWEAHDELELRRILPLKPAIVGINNRDLRTFEVSLETTRRLLPQVPRGAVSVSESGFSRRDELERMAEWGVKAFLIGESLLRAPDPGAQLELLLRPEGGAAP